MGTYNDGSDLQPEIKTAAQGLGLTVAEANESVQRLGLAEISGKVWNAAIYIGLLGVGAGEYLTLLPPGSGTLAGVVASIGMRNSLDADRAFAEVMRSEAKGMREGIDILKADAEERDRRLTLLFRAFQEAGRHPNKTIREALGRFAARVQYSDLDAVEAFEVASVLADLTALDFAFIEAVQRKETCRWNGIGGMSQTPVEEDLATKRPTGPVELSDSDVGKLYRAVLDELHRDFPKLEAHRMVSEALRLDRLRLLVRSPYSTAVGWTGLTELGESVLRMSRRPPVGFTPG